MATLTRQQLAEAVLSELRGVGPQTVAGIRSDLGITQRQVEEALHYLMARALVEYADPIQSPLIYKAAAATREP